MADDDSDDAMRAGHELRSMIEQVEQAAEEEAEEEAAMGDTADAVPDTGAVPDADPRRSATSPVGAPPPTHVTSPYGDVHKATMVVELLTATSDGASLDPSRVRRVAQAAKLSADHERADNSAVPTGRRIGRGTDVCMVFRNEVGQGYFTQCGRVSAMYTAKTRELKHPIDFDSRPADLEVVCHWYTANAADRTGLTFAYNIDDFTRYHAK